ncbi:MAG TPA: SUMF1/EgtB/PvdO family nonheme iron enzyme [Candidatus Tectomicrobia bacterium]
MLWRAGWLGGLVLALNFLTLDTAMAQPRRTALVIGNAAYESGPLRNPVNDAADIAAALQRLGFDVSLLRDAKMRAMEEAIETFSQKLRKGGVGLFYFAGHGLQVAGENYIVPIGARISREQDVRFETVQVGRVLGGMEDAGNDVNLIILDACRDNPFARSFRSGAQRGLAVSSAVRGSLMAYATAPGKTAADGDGRNGVYTQQLLKYITAPGMKVEDVFKRVRLSVEDATNGQQTPWETTSLRGDFYFTGPDGAAASAAMATPSPSSSSGKSRPSSGDTSSPQTGIRPLSNPSGSQPQLGPQVAVGIYPPTVQTPAPTPSLQTQRNSLGMELVRIHPGEFMMGAEKGDSDEKPVRKVTISKPFYLGKYEVTQAQWQDVMGTNPSHFKGDPNRPVERVSWKMVQEFISKLNAREGHSRYRLPTEAEWEYAARAGSTTKYSFGDDDAQLEQYAWYNKNDKGTTHPVGQLQPNAWGLYDMHGNVWEWVHDWRGPYTGGQEVDPQGPVTGNAKGYRGGGWGYGAVRCRSTDRSYDSPDYIYGTHGFRLAMTAQ